MQNFMSNTFALGSNMGQFGRDFGPSVKGTTPGFMRGDTGHLRGEIPGRFNTTPGAPMRAFEKSGFRSEGMNDYAPPYHETEETNPRVTIQGRRIIPLASSSLGNADLGPPCERRLMFTWRARPSGSVLIPLGSSQPSNFGDAEGMPSFLNSLFGATSTPTEFPMSPLIPVEAMPTLSASVEQLNYALADLQSRWAEQDESAYRSLSADMLHYGCRDLPFHQEAWPVVQKFRKLPGFNEYEGFCCEGIPRNVIADDGTAPQHDDVGVMYYGGPRSVSAAKGYSVAATTLGPETCLDYWEGNGTKTGNYLYLMLKKFHPDFYNRPGNDAPDKQTLFEYHLANKPSDTQRDPTSMRRVVKMGPVTNDRNQPVAARPFQYGFVSSPHALKRSAACCEDEWGQMHEGVLISVGIVQFPPTTGTSNPPLDPMKIRPYMDNRYAVGNDPLEVILTLDDGISCAY